MSRKSALDKLLETRGLQSLGEYREMLRDRSFLSTGIPELDQLIANGREKDGKPFGGLPRSAITEISGQFGCYKTTLMKMIASRPDVEALYIDTEGSFSNDDVDNNFDMVMENNIEKIWGLVDDCLDGEAGKQYDLIVVDSIAGATTEQEIDKDNETANLNVSKAKALNQWCRVMLPKVQKSNTAVVFVNQLREKIGGFYTDFYTPGGKALEFYPSLRLQLFAPKSKNKNGVQEIRVKVSKSRFGPKGAETSFKLMFKKGDTHATLFSEKA